MSAARNDGRRRVLLGAFCCVLAGCGARIVNENSAPGGLAVVAVAAAPDVNLDVTGSAIALLLEDALRASGHQIVTPLAQVRARLGAERQALLSQQLAETGTVSSELLQQLMATPLEARYGLLVRVERNETEILEPVQQAYRDLSGVTTDDRQTVVLASRRNVRIAAIRVDLVTGSVAWQRAWTAAPVASADYVRYTGSSFSGSVSASIVNSVINGLRGPSAPPPPDLEVALDAIFIKMIDELPES